ncbi:MAG: hypothetical protein O7F76_07385 [Planctomycetota bacterium]|nr:hypothetical protein [Planctomycetota bacterium]
MRAARTVFYCWIGYFVVVASLVEVVHANQEEVQVETFDGGGNMGGWSYFGAPGNGIEVIEVAGGNPGAYLHSTCVGLNCLDTFAPQPRTELGNGGVFVGNYRARDVTSLGIDLILHTVDFGAGGRPLSLILSGGGLSTYIVGPEDVPEPGEGWKSFDFPVPSQSPTLPTGWVVQNGSGQGDDADWNTIITGVTQVTYFYGDPEFFFIFQQWEPGLDKSRITEGSQNLADMNCDTQVQLDDLPRFVQALIDPESFAGCDINRADINCDGVIDGRDVGGFVVCLLNEGCP